LTERSKQREIRWISCVSNEQAVNVW